MFNTFEFIPKPVDPIKFTNDQKRMMVEKLANWIETKKIRMIPIEETKKELSNLTFRQTNRYINC